MESTKTTTMADLPSPITKSEDVISLRDLIRDAAERLMDIEISTLCNADHDERTPLLENL